MATHASHAPLKLPTYRVSGAMLLVALAGAFLAVIEGDTALWYGFLGWLTCTFVTALQAHGQRQEARALAELRSGVQS